MWKLCFYESIAQYLVSFSLVCIFSQLVKLLSLVKHVLSFPTTLSWVENFFLPFLSFNSHSHAYICKCVYSYYACMHIFLCICCEISQNYFIIFFTNGYFIEYEKYTHSGNWIWIGKRLMLEFLFELLGIKFW